MNPCEQKQSPHHKVQGSPYDEPFTFQADQGFLVHLLSEQDGRYY